MVKECIICGKTFETNINTITCSLECRIKRRQGYQRCPVCGNIFSVRGVKWGNGRHKMKKKKYCSKECAKKAARRRSKERYKNDKAYREKIRGYQQKYNQTENGKNILQANKMKRDKRIKNKNNIDTISLQELYERDGGVCWLYGESCDYDDKEYRVSKSGRGYLATGPNYPSVDHVVPLSKGGTHTWDNVKLAHKRCNSKKCDNNICK